MRIGVIADWMSPNMLEAVRLLIERGVVMEVLYPEKQMTELARVRVKHDLYLLKSSTDLALSFAGALHELGAVSLNSYPTAVKMQNKIVLTRILQAAEVPVPDTYMATNRLDLIPLLETGPLILKPYRGCRGEGIHVVWNAAQLENLPLEQTVFAQRYHPSGGYDHKIFCIGERLVGVRRIFPLRTYADKTGEPFPITPVLRSIALRCGQALGVNLFGVDLVISDGLPYVVDMNKFCSFMGVPEGPRLLADYIHAAGKRVLRGEPPVPQLKAPVEAAGRGPIRLASWNQPEDEKNLPEGATA